MGPSPRASDMLRPQLDGLRFAMFMMVFTYHHYWFVGGVWFMAYSLPVFLALTGFLITRILVENECRPLGPFLMRFYLRRVLRIFPVYYLVLSLGCIAGILPYAKWQFAYLFNMKVFQLSLNHVDMMKVFPPDKWPEAGAHLWSLSADEQYYLLYPLLLLFTPPKRRGWMLVGLILVSIVVREYFIVAHPTAFRGALLPVCGEYIIWGCLAAYWDHMGVFKRVSASGLVYGGLVSAGLLWATGSAPVFGQFLPGQRQTLFGPTFAVIILGLWKSDHTWPARLLSLKPIAYLGKISYGLYVIHIFTFIMFPRLVVEFPGLSVVHPYFGTLVLTVALGMLSWHLIESPLNDLKKLLPYRMREPRIIAAPSSEPVRT